VMAVYPSFVVVKNHLLCLFISLLYVGCFGTLFMRRVVASDRTTKRRTTRCRTMVLHVAMSLTKHTKRRVVVRHVVAMSLCPSDWLFVYIAKYGG
jgi:UDP-N-acetylmuramyl pentapeptide phosphotransferase/UDP-N-acetylglucosamine-1-phosphate transferase